MRWYYADKGETRGPVTREDLRRLVREGRVKPNDYVWHPSMGENWTEARNVSGLLETAAPAWAPPGPEPAAGRGVSCVAAVGPAWQGMKSILFRPFEIGKWFALGFAAWLASLGQGGGSGGGNLNPARPGEQKPKLDDAVATWQQHVLPFLREHGSTIALVGALAVILFLALTLLVLWVRARGKFMFLDNVLNNRAEIRHPWHVFAQHGNSLFRWTVGYAVICLLIGILLAAATFVSAVKPCIAAGAFTTAALPGLVVSIVLWIVFGIITAYIGRFLEDFIVPLMYKHDLTTREAWARFLPVFRHNAGAFVIYGLFYLVLSMIAGFCVLLLIIATCCIAACIVGIPYLGTVLLLPIPVFFRLYSLEYLAQYGRGCTLEPEG